MTKYNDDGIPGNYYFVVDVNPEIDGAFMVALTPVKYWNQKKRQSDWELAFVAPDWLDEVMESTYAVEELDLTISQDVHNAMLLLGLQYSPEFARFMGVGQVSATCTPSAPPTIAATKITTNYLRDVIAVTLTNDPKFSELFEAYNSNEPEWTSMREWNNWKRAFKKKATVRKVAEDAARAVYLYGQCGAFEQAFVEKTHFVPGTMDVSSVVLKVADPKDFSGVIYDSSFCSNFDAPIIVREFWWTDNSDGDTTISFITNEEDTKILAITYHID